MSEDSPEAGEPGSESRRGLLRAAGAGLGAAIVAGCGGSTSIRAQVHDSESLLGTDVNLLNSLLHLEHLAIAAYTAGTPLLDPSTVKAGRLFLNDELFHAGSLAGWIKAAGGTPIKPEPSFDLGHPRTSQEVLALLHQVEAQQIAAYIEALPYLAPAVVRTSVAAILANDAQHVAVVRAALGQPPVPSPLVTGRE